MCCVMHDFRYRVGKTPADKYRADIELFQCMREEGYPVIGALYFVFVSTLGWISWFRKRWRKPKPPTPVEMSDL